MRLLLPLLLLPCLVQSDAGPVYGMDYAGLDYNVTNWHSPSNDSGNHWYAAMLLCQALCDDDPACCAWTYVTPEGGASDPERCCLKYGVPVEVAASTHWTGLPTRSNSSVCTNPPYPGPVFARPAIHNTPACVFNPGWHDIAGALSYRGSHHVWQGCPGAGGWHHAVSTDLVHWDNLGIDMVTLPEPYGSSSPCSGFVTVDDDGVPCAGFRECSGNWPGRSNQQVPLELRCALNDNLTSWSSMPEYIFWFYFNRGLPYDPVRPWKDSDGMWYATIAADGCNSTSTPCGAGGREYLFTSPALHGPNANWSLVGPMWTSNYTVLTPITGAVLDRELVTVDYMGDFAGDPAGGSTRVLTNNVCGNGCCDCSTGWYMGSQSGPGGAFSVDYAAPNATGMIDWSSFAPTGAGAGIAGLSSVGGGAYRMARTLSSDPNQVGVAGRRIMIAWLSAPSGTSLQSLPRDLTLDAEGTGLLQQFVPELAVLRNASTQLAVGRTPTSPLSLTSITLTAANDILRSVASQQIEVVVEFTYAPDATLDAFGINTLLSEDGQDLVPVGVAVGVAQVFVKDRAGPLSLQPSAPNTVWMHAFVDHQIVTVIVNNRTALTVFSTPRDAGSNGLELFGVDGMTVNATLQAWTLNSIN